MLICRRPAACHFMQAVSCDYPNATRVGRQNRWPTAVPSVVSCSILLLQATCVIGNGVVVHLPGLFEEIRGMQARAHAGQGDAGREAQPRCGRE